MCNPVQIAIVPWSDARAQQAMRSVRHTVFIEEQKVPAALEWDGLDADAVHVLARASYGVPIGTARLLPDGHIGRVAVIAPWRRKGVGSEMLGALVEVARQRGWRAVHLNAQISALTFYEQHGFVAEGPEFMDAGIAHRHMTKALE